MELNVKEKKENPLLYRTEIKAGLIYKGSTPSKENVRKLVTDQLSLESELTVIKNIKTAFGFERAKLLIYVYKDKDKLKRIEPRVKKEKSKEKKEKDAQKEVKKEEKVKQKEGTPKEEGKEEAKGKEENKPEKKEAETKEEKKEK